MVSLGQFVAPLVIAATTFAGGDDIKGPRLEPEPEASVSANTPNAVEAGPTADPIKPRFKPVRPDQLPDSLRGVVPNRLPQLHAKPVPGSKQALKTPPLAQGAKLTGEIQPYDVAAEELKQTIIDNAPVKIPGEKGQADRYTRSALTAYEAELLTNYVEAKSKAGGDQGISLADQQKVEFLILQAQDRFKTLEYGSSLPKGDRAHITDAERDRIERYEPKTIPDKIFDPLESVRRFINRERWDLLRNDSVAEKPSPSNIIFK